MPDSEFFSRELTNVILQAEFDGRLKHNEGQKVAAGTLATLTAATGKDLYLMAAKINWGLETTADGSPDALENVCELQADTVVKETSMYSYENVLRESTDRIYNYDFKSLGHKVVASKVLRLEVIVIESNTVVEGFIQAIEVPTGQNPLTYRGA